MKLKYTHCVQNGLAAVGSFGRMPGMPGEIEGPDAWT